MEFVFFIEHTFFSLDLVTKYGIKLSLCAWQLLTVIYFIDKYMYDIFYILLAIPCMKFILLAITVKFFTLLAITCMIFTLLAIT